jgi:hypothetical protein
MIIIAMIIKDERTKDGERIDRYGIKDGKIITVINKIKMASIVKMGITKMAIIGIITTKIMEIGMEGI